MSSFSQRKLSLARRLRLEQLEARLPLDASALVISEIMAKNEGVLFDAEGDSPDWIEIFNSGSETVDLTGMELIDSSDRWEFQAGTTLDAGEFLVVFASDKNTVFNGTEQHTNFKLTTNGEYLGLIDADGTTVIDEFAPEFPIQFEDLTYGSAMEEFGDETFHVSEGDNARGLIPLNDSLGLTWTEPDYNDASWPISGPTGFGYENSPGAPTNFVDEIETSVPSGTTNLYMRVPFTLSSLGDIGSLTLKMMYDDGFVTYLNGHRFASANAPDNLGYNTPASGMRSDTLGQQFSEFDASGAIPHLQVGQNVLAIHALNLSGSSDMLHVPELYSTPSQLVTPESIGFFTQPTPGYGNVGLPIAGFVEQPTVSVPHGFYETTQSVTLATETTNSILVYTTDGSTPTVDGNLNVTNGQLYTTPLSISSTTTLRAVAFRTDYEPSPILASTYLFVDDILQQSPQGQLPGPGWGPDGLNGQVLDYGIDPEIISLYGAEAVKDSLKSLTTFSITTDIGNLFDQNTGIYVNALNRGFDWERPTSVELIDPDGGFSVNAGLRIRGGFSRNDFNPKHAFRFYFRDDYGDTKLRYDLFDGEGAEKFDVLDLRTAQNYAWSRDGNAQNTFAREIFARDLQKEMGQTYTRSRYHHLYVNGHYWGIFQTQERVEEFYGESYLGGDKDDYDVFKAQAYPSGETEISNGNDLAWRELFDLAEGLSSNPSGNANNYWTMQGLNLDGTRNENLPILLDVDNLADFMLIVFYTGGYDVGISQFFGNNKSNNWFGLRNRETNDHGFHFFVHDNEHSLGTNETEFIDRTGPFNNGNQSNYTFFNPGYLHQDLMASPEYRLAFADRVRQHMFDGGPMTPAASLAILQARVAQVEPAIIAEAARWGDAHIDTPRNKTDWENEINTLDSNLFSLRRSLVLGQLGDDDLYPDVEAPSYNQYGGLLTSPLNLQMSAPQGTIYYTLDGSDPRATGGGLNSGSAQVYSTQLNIAENQTVNARVRSNGEWSALTTATFTFPLTGDYDASGAVDQDDLARWQTEYGTTTGATADGDNDGDADGFDFLAWQRNLGAGQADAVAALAPASEPVTESATEPAVAVASTASFFVTLDSVSASIPTSTALGSDLVEQTAAQDSAFAALSSVAGPPQQLATLSETSADATATNLDSEAAFESLAEEFASQFVGEAWEL